MEHHLDGVLDPIFVACFCAMGAVGLGLTQFLIPNLAIGIFILMAIYIFVWVVIQYLGKCRVGCRVVHGYGLEHPCNPRPPLPRLDMGRLESKPAK